MQDIVPAALFAVGHDVDAGTILVTHDQIEATTMADRIVVMNAGRVEQEGTAKDLYERPATLFVASFVGSPPINLLEGQAAGGALKVHEATLSLSQPAQGAILLGLRPESVRANGAGTPARIVAVEPMGREVLYSADCALGRVHFLEGGAEARHREGDSVALAFSPADSLLFDKTSGRRLDARVAA